MSCLKLNNLACGYPQHGTKNSELLVVNQLNLTLNDGEIACLLGPSGCGKTTVLRAIAGFHGLNAGEIWLSDHKLADVNSAVPPERRRIGMVFQDYALFPHLSVKDNVTFGLHKLSKSEQNSICHEMLSLVKLEHLGDRFPHELSGGQQQRVALARALAAKPSLLLLDEPFSNLDVDLRRTLALEVRNILKQQNITAIMVTHDQEEAFAFADVIGVMNDGKLHQWDTPYNLYHQPNSRFVASFIGQGVFLSGRINKQHIETELGHVACDVSSSVSENPVSENTETHVDVLVRPDDIIHDQSSTVTGEVCGKIFAGTSTLYTLKLPSGTELLANFPSHLDYSLGQEIPLSANFQHLISYAKETA